MDRVPEIRVSVRYSKYREMGLRQVEREVLSYFAVFDLFFIEEHTKNK